MYFLRDDDIPQYVEDAVADIGIVGENVVYEKNKDIEVVSKLGFGHCRLSIAVPKNMNYQSIADLEDLKIATSYTRLLQNFSLLISPGSNRHFLPYNSIFCWVSRASSCSFR